MTISPELIELYRNTNYCVSDHEHEFVLRIGMVSKEAKRLLSGESDDGAVFITAWNPFGKEVTRLEKDEANSRLRNDLKELGGNVLAGYGCSPDQSWREDSYLYFPVSRSTAAAFCRRYQQNAVIFVDSNGVPELIFNSDVFPA